MSIIQQPSDPNEPFVARSRHGTSAYRTPDSAQMTRHPPQTGSGRSMPPEIIQQRPPLVGMPVPRPQPLFRRGRAPEAPGGNQMVDSYYLILAGRKRRTVARIVGLANHDIAVGSGFLVGPCLLMTCHHTVPTARNARYYMAQFDYLQVWGDARETRRSDLHTLRPDVFFHSNKELDYAITFVEPWSTPRPEQSRGTSLLRRKWNQLHETRWKYEQARYEQWVNIIQHPHGGLQKVALRDSQAKPLRGRRPHHLHYMADTNQKSSGSPVWNDKWELVGLHHRAIPNPRRLWRKRGRWMANQGVRTSEIARSMRAYLRQGRQLEGLGPATKALDPNVKLLLEECFAAPEPAPDEWGKQAARIAELRDDILGRP